MTVVAKVSAEISLCDPQRAAIKARKYYEDIDAGEAVAVTSAGLAELASAAAQGNIQFRGIALQSRLAGEVGDIFEGGLGLGGEIEGFTVDGLSPEDILYLSDTAGALDTGAGTTEVVCGIVSCLTDPDLTQVVRICMQVNYYWPVIHSL